MHFQLIWATVTPPGRARPRRARRRRRRIRRARTPRRARSTRRPPRPRPPAAERPAPRLRALRGSPEAHLVTPHRLPATAELRPARLRGRRATAATRRATTGPHRARTAPRRATLRARPGTPEVRRARRGAREESPEARPARPGVRPDTIRVRPGTPAAPLATATRRPVRAGSRRQVPLRRDLPLPAAAGPAAGRCLSTSRSQATRRRPPAISGCRAYLTTYETRAGRAARLLPGLGRGQVSRGLEDRPRLARTLSSAGPSRCSAVEVTAPVLLALLFSRAMRRRRWGLTGPAAEGDGAALPLRPLSSRATFLHRCLCHRREPELRGRHAQQLVGRDREVVRLELVEDAEHPRDRLLRPEDLVAGEVTGRSSIRNRPASETFSTGLQNLCGRSRSRIWTTVRNPAPCGMGAQARSFVSGGGRAGWALSDWRSTAPPIHAVGSAR
jgi:hypothetical protein